MLKESDIAYENDTHWVFRKPGGDFEVYRLGLTHSTRCAVIGYKGEEGLAKAIEEADRRHKEATNAGRTWLSYQG